MIYAKLNEKNYDYYKKYIRKYEKKEFFVYYEVFGQALDSELKNSKNKFFAGVGFEINNKIINIDEKDISLFELNDNVILRRIDSVKFREKNYFSKVRETLLNEMINLIDIDSREGKEKLLENFIDTKNIPNWLENQVKEFPSYRFKRLVNRKKENSKIFLNLVVGTYHPGYNKFNWIDMYYDLKRTSNIIKALLFPEYYEELQKDSKRELMSFVKFDDEIYIDSGNHRTTLSKLKGLEYIYAPMAEYMTDYSYKEYYEFLEKNNFKVNLPIEKKHNRYDYDNIEYEWEVFEVEYNGKCIILKGLNEIKNFCEKIYINKDKAIKLTLKEIIKDKINKYLKIVKI
ncbi:hypothetical protein [Clostridium saccharoperbutylacetonicum]